MKEKTADEMFEELGYKKYDISKINFKSLKEMTDEYNKIYGEMSDEL